MSDYQPIILAPEDRKKWLSERNQGIGSSEVAVIMGVSSFMTPYDLWAKKTQQQKDVEAEDNAILRAGHMLEPVVAQYFEQDTGKQVITSTAGDWVAYDPERPWLRVSPDRLYWLDEAKTSKGILECKTTQRLITPDDIPPAYFCQVQYQMGVMAIPYAELAWLRSGYDFGHVGIEFNPEFFRLMADKVTDWWQEHIVKGAPPKPVTANDVRRYIPALAGSEVEAGEDALAAVNQLRELNEQMKQLEAQKAELQDRLAVAMGAAERLVITDASGRKALLATYKEQSSTRLDTKALKADHADLVSEYSKTSSTRVLRLK